MVDKKNYTILFRSDTGENWARYNPVLGKGEPGFDTTSGLVKIGNGVSSWTSLPFYTGSAYDIARANGFTGTQAEWLESLKVKGDKGDSGDNFVIHDMDSRYPNDLVDSGWYVEVRNERITTGNNYPVTNSPTAINHIVIGQQSSQIALTNNTMYYRVKVSSSANWTSWTKNVSFDDMASASSAGLISSTLFTRLNGATSASTASALMMRDSNGRSNTKNPLSAENIANFQWVMANFFSQYGVTSNLNTLIVPGNYYVSATGTTTANGFPVADFIGIVTVNIFNSNNQFIAQNAITQAGRRFFRSTTNGGSAWTTWVEYANNSLASDSANGLMPASLYTAINTATASNTPNTVPKRDGSSNFHVNELFINTNSLSGSTSAVPKGYLDSVMGYRMVSAIDLGTTSLDADRADGVYVQTSDAGATTALKYPITKKGTLLQVSYGGMITQIYQHPGESTFGATRLFIRGRNATGSFWNTWKEISNTATATVTNNGLMSAADKDLLQRATYLTDGDAIVKRHPNGQIQVPEGTPPWGYSAPSKSYVDGLIDKDTGWRNVTTFLSTPFVNSSTAPYPIRMRRKGDRVTVSAQLQSASSSTVMANAGLVLNNIPTGFQLTGTSIGPYGNVAIEGVASAPTTQVGFVNNNSTVAFNIRFPHSASGQAYGNTTHKIYLFAEWLTTDAWPSTLPGTSA